MSLRDLRESLAEVWLRTLQPFDRELVDHGERYHGNPVFTVKARFPGHTVDVKVYRYTPLNSSTSKLAFVPEPTP